MIDRIQIVGFKSLRSVDVRLQRLTVLIGPNASGKSSVLTAFDSVCRSTLVEPDRVFSDLGGVNAIVTHGANEVLLETHVGTESFGVCAVRESAGGSVSTNGHSQSGWNFRRDRVVRVSADSESSYEFPDRDPERERTIRRFGGSTLVRLEGRQLARPSYSTMKMPQIGPDGFGLATRLAFLKLSAPDQFELIEKCLRIVVPAIRRIRFERCELIQDDHELHGSGPDRKDVRVRRGVVGDGLLFDTNRTAGVPAGLASEGTLMALGVITVILGPDQPRHVLLDDLDHGLHPKAQKQLVGVIRRIMNEIPDVQIIATTHSPYLVDELEPQEVVLTTLRDDGTTACARLDEHPDFKKWKDEMAPGEFWSSVGEKWVTEREAAGTAP